MDRDGAGEHVVWLPGGLVLVRDDSGRGVKTRLPQ
jgi:hypothetical protein